jgi:hypothetical protein
MTTVSVTAVVDCVAALATRSLDGNMYMYDTNRLGGSTGFGTEEAQTLVRKGDQVVWTVHPLECEAYVAIDSILIDPTVCAPEEKVYEGTDISYWTGTVKKNAPAAVPYQIRLRIGTRTEPISGTRSAALVSSSTEPS